jgi:hypothetical protein
VVEVASPAERTTLTWMLRLQEVPYPTRVKLLELDLFVSPCMSAEKDLPKRHSRQPNLVSPKGLVILPPSEGPFPASRRRVPISLPPSDRLTKSCTQQALPPFVTLLQPPDNPDNVDTGIQRH